MNKNIIFLTTILFALSNCSDPFDPPEKIALNYYQNLIMLNEDKAYELISELDKNMGTLDDFRKSVTFDFGDIEHTTIQQFNESDEIGLGKLLLSLTNISVVNSNTIKNDSTVELSVEVIDLEKVTAMFLEKFLGNFLGSDSLTMPNDQDAKSFVLSKSENLKNIDLPRKKLKNVMLNLIKNDLGWQIAIDLESLIKTQAELELEQKLEIERIAAAKEQELMLLAEQKKAKAEQLKIDEEAKRIAQEKKLQDLTIQVEASTDEFTDKPSVIRMTFLWHSEEGNYNPRAITLAKYINGSYAVFLMNQPFSVNSFAEVKFRFDDNQAFSQRFNRKDDLVFNTNERFFYKMLRELEGTEQILIGVEGESSFKTAKYFDLQKKYTQFLCLIDQYDPVGVNSDELSLFPTKYYQYNQENCTL